MVMFFSSISLFNEMVSIEVFFPLFFQFVEKDSTLPFCLCSNNKGGRAIDVYMAHSMIDFIM